MIIDPHSVDACHIRLLAGHGEDGQPVCEVLRALRREADLFVLAGSPGLVLGFAAGDLLRVSDSDSDSGAFESAGQGGNVCVQAFREDGFTREQFADLTDSAGLLDGHAEAPPNLRFIAVKIGRSVGLAAIEQCLNGGAAEVDGVEWWFGNVDEPV
ncbi:DUF4265 domain-containing protein [Streptacidiphilus sp. PB12-B1b]|uniref:DUF4265 domain-containing protein n=1 Tax=Streptacidiphilus sp. PB12-B1b TaxID=2705012 RepID=UPI0015FDCB7C|nr:DUF4265 domain-containing protein [Streptacidiphilus sp. PB12-B1b]QMU76954.1 DUF4265 domain-containing protein [Streptacidiphilus sp. PB12-B1b]